MYEAIKNIEYNGYKVNYYDNGPANAECIVFFHAAFTDHRIFKDQFEFFIEKKYRVIAIDMLGHGFTKPLKTKDKVDVSIEYVKTIMNVESIETVHLVGVSMGSLMAQYFAYMYPEKTLSLTVLGGYDISADTSEIMKAQRKEGLKWMAMALFSMNSFRKYVARVSVKHAQNRVHVYESAKCFTRKSFMYMNGMANVIKKQESKFECPLLILVGEHDLQLAKRAAENFHKSIVTSKFEIINNAGHCANIDKSYIFNTVLLQFIRSIN